MSYLRTLKSILPHITAAGGKAIAVTAEPEQRLADTINATGYSGDVIVDAKNKIAADSGSKHHIIHLIKQRLTTSTCKIVIFSDNT
jgi:hypothetical protein